MCVLKGLPRTVFNSFATALLGLESFHSVSEGVYGEGGRIGLILNRLNNGEYLTYVERNHLYDYFQSILRDEKRKEISEIASMINEKNIDQLKDRLNEKVIISKDLIEEEMAMIQAYMYRGNNKIGDLEIKRETLTKLEAYLVLLKNYHSAMGNETIAKVDILQYKDSPNRVSEYYFESYLEMVEYDSNIRRFYSEEDFRSFAFDPDSYVKKSC